MTTNYPSQCLKMRRVTTKQRPDYTGTVTLADGKDMRMAAWVRESKSGVKYLSGRLSEPQVQASEAGSNAAVEGADVPF